MAEQPTYVGLAPAIARAVAASHGVGAAESAQSAPAHAVVCAQPNGE